MALCRPFFFFCAIMFRQEQMPASSAKPSNRGSSKAAAPPPPASSKAATGNAATTASKGVPSSTSKPQVGGGVSKIKASTRHNLCQHEDPVTGEICCPLRGNFRHCDDFGHSLGFHTYADRRCSLHQLPGQRCASALGRTNKAANKQLRQDKYGITTDYTYDPKRKYFLRYYFVLACFTQ
jgi:hypothetical protein